MPIDISFAPPAGEEYVEVVDDRATATASSVPGLAGSTPDIDAAESDYANWVRSSRDIALDYGKSMLTASAGAVAVYFSVVNYLVANHSHRAVSYPVIIAAPTLFLASSAAFALALRPRLVAIGPENFVALRDERLSRLNTVIGVGLGLFLAGMLAASASFAYLLRMR